jgi:uncharacterized protein YcbK (DUF882 family)
MEIHRILRDMLYVAGIFALVAAGALFLSARKTVQHADAFLTARNIEGLPMTIRHTNQILKETGETLVEVKKASTQQAAYSRKLLGSLDKANTDLGKLGEATDQLKTLLANTDLRLNGALLPSLTHNVVEMEYTIDALTTDADVLRRTLDHADAEVSSPDIPATLKNLRETSANVASMTAHTDATAADIQVAVHRWTKPPHGIWNFVKGLLAPAAHAAELYHFL